VLLDIATNVFNLPPLLESRNQEAAARPIDRGRMASDT